MPIAQNRVYNDPNIGAAFSNIAGLFAPPSAQELSGYADAALKKQQREKIAALWDAAASPNFNQDVFDRQNIAIGNYAPTSSYYKVNTDDATTRRGQDVTAATSRANNAADNTRQVVTSLFGSLSPGDIRPEIPADIAGQFGLPALPQVAGAPKPLSETEVKGGIIQGLSPEEQRAVGLAGISTTNIVGADGKPVISYEHDAVGQQPYFNQGAEAKPENKVALLRDGTQVPAVQGPDGRWYHAQSKALLPDDIKIFNVPQAQGTATDVGLSKPTDTYIEKQLIDIGIAKDTAIKLRDLIKQSPASQGAVGWLRGTAQNVIQTGGELGAFFGGNVAEVANDIKRGLADASLADAFDTNIPAIEMLSNLLAFQYAKTTTGERLSNEMLRAAKQALGLDGIDANQANSLARLNQAIAQIESQENILKRVQNEGIGAASSPAGPAAVPTAPATDGGPPAGWTAEEWGVLTEDEKAQVLNGE